jgi:membrane-bound serine protease (ClpP class)
VLAVGPDSYFVASPDGLASFWYLIFIAGLLLLAVEAFVPGFHVIGITGIVLVIYGLVLAFQFTASITTVLAAAVLALVTVGVLIKYASEKGIFRRLALDSTAPGGTTAPAKMPCVGQEGVSITPLRPSGTAQFGTDRYSVITEGEFIQPGVRVEVISSAGGRITVRRADSIQ